MAAVAAFQISLTLNVDAYAVEPTDKLASLRNVKLVTRDAKEGACYAVLWHTDCPLHEARLIAAWARRVLGIPVVEYPAGNLAHGWNWPHQPTAPAPVPAQDEPKKSDLDFDP